MAYLKSQILNKSKILISNDQNSSVLWLEIPDFSIFNPQSQIRNLFIPGSPRHIAGRSPDVLYDAPHSPHSSNIVRTFSLQPATLPP